MSLLGKGAMLLWFDIDAEAVPEHDDWHTHEHLPERLSIPGFRRGTRWTSLKGSPRYFVIYEAADAGVLGSPAYLERLNHPTPWTSKMMPHYRGMTRGLCSVTASAGLGVGQAVLSIRLAPATDREGALREWIVGALPRLASRPGLVGASLFESALAPAMTAEQRIRGKDAGVEWVLVVTGYDEAVLGGIAEAELGAPALEAQGAAPGRAAFLHRKAVALTAIEAGNTA